MRFNRGIAAGLVVFALVGAAAAPLRASEEDSKTLFAQGRKLRAEGKCEEAVTAFRRALELYPSGLGALRNIAECEEKIGMYAAARRDWWDLRRAALQTNEPKYDGWEAAAEKAYNALDAKVPKIIIKLTGERLDDAKVVLDGKPVDPRLLGVEIERDLGAHTIEVFFDNVAPLTSKVTLGEGARETVTIEVPSAAPAPKKRQGQEDTGAASMKGPLRSAGFAALGVGAVGVVGAAIVIAVRAGSLSDIKSTCPDYETTRCPDALKGSYSTGVTTSTLANVFGSVAIAGVGAGVTLLVLSRDTSPATSSSKPKASASVGVAPTWGGAEAHVLVRF